MNFKDKEIFESTNGYIVLKKDNLKYIAEELQNILKIKFWTCLPEETINNILNHGSDSAPSEYYNVVFTYHHDIPLMNVIINDMKCGFSRGSKALYTYNLKTQNVSQNSKLKNELPDILKKYIYDNVQLCPHTRIIGGKNIQQTFK